jgi:hypothetical protein
MKKLPSLRKHIIALGVFVLLFIFSATVHANPHDRYVKKLSKQNKKVWNQRKKQLKKANRKIARWPGNTKAKGFAYATIDHTVKCPNGKCNKPK